MDKNGDPQTIWEWIVMLWKYMWNRKKAVVQPGASPKVPGSHERCVDSLLRSGLAEARARVRELEAALATPPANQTQADSDTLIDRHPLLGQTCGDYRGPDHVGDAAAMIAFPVPDQGVDARERVALAIRRATCRTPTYPWHVFRQDAEANILEWCRYAADDAIAALAQPDQVAALRDEVERLKDHSASRAQDMITLDGLRQAAEVRAATLQAKLDEARKALERLRPLSEAAHEGPFRLGPYKSDILVTSRKGGDAKLFDVRGSGYYSGQGHGALHMSHDQADRCMAANAEFIVAAANTIRDLLAATAPADTMDGGRDGR